MTAELEAVAAALADLHHPHLWQSVSAPHPRALGVITPDGMPTLAEWLKARREQSQGVTAREAAALLEPAAEALDALHARPGFPHALVSDATILVDDGRGVITGYGVSELLRLSSADAEWARHDPFVAPETAAGTPHPAGDQYSLALVFLELIGRGRCCRKASGPWNGFSGTAWPSPSAGPSAPPSARTRPGGSSRAASSWPPSARRPPTGWSWTTSGWSNRSPG